MAAFTALAVAATVAATGVSVYSTIQRNKAKKKAQQQQYDHEVQVAKANQKNATQESEYQRQLAENDAKYQLELAENERKIIKEGLVFRRTGALKTQAVLSRKIGEVQRQGELAEEVHFKKVRSLSASQRAAFAANGVLINDGTAVDILGDTAAQGEVDALIIRSNTEQKAQGFREERANFEREADFLEQSLQSIEDSPLPPISITTRPAPTFVAPPRPKFDSSGRNLEIAGAVLGGVSGLVPLIPRS